MNIYHTVCNRRLMTILLLGFASGLPLSLTTNALQAWYTSEGISIVAIGFLAIIGLPYVFKFLWAPILDRYVPPLLGRRRGWILITQLALLASIASMSFFSPAIHPKIIGLLALLVAFSSATQDIAIDAYRTDVLYPAERGIGAAWGVAGYRLAMLLSGGVAFIVADYIGWNQTYLIMAFLMGIGIFASLVGPEPSHPVKAPETLVDATIQPFREFLKRKNALGFLWLIVLYKLGDAFVLSLATPFLLRGLSFTLTEVGVMVKGVGLFATLAGVFAGGLLMTQMGQFRALFLFGCLQALSNILFLLLAWVGKNYLLAGTVLFFEHLVSGMSTAAFVALLMGLCDKRYTAAQFALFSALAAVGRVIVGPIAGLLVDWVGWTQYFLWAFLVTLPGLFVLWYLRQQIEVDRTVTIGGPS